MTDETKKEIAAFLRERMIAEQKQFHEFVEHMTNKGFYGGSVIVKFNDGTTDEYPLSPEDPDDIISFAQSLCTKRVQEFQKQLKNYE